MALAYQSPEINRGRNSLKQARKRTSFVHLSPLPPTLPMPLQHVWEIIAPHRPGQVFCAAVCSDLFKMVSAGTKVQVCLLLSTAVRACRLFSPQAFAQLQTLSLSLSVNHSVCVCVCVCARARACVRASERERERESVCV